MVCSWDKLIGVIFILFKMISFIHCCRPQVTNAYFSVHYVKLGKPFALVVDFKAEKQAYRWRKDGKPLAIKNCIYNRESVCNETRIYTYKDNPSLKFSKTSLEDSGKYILELFPQKRRVYSFEIIVEAKSFVYTDCDDMIAYEGDNVSCICETAIHNPNVTITWNSEQGYSGINNFSTDILVLENISRNQSGTYTCFSKSHNVVNKTSFNLTVVPKNSVTTNTRMKVEYLKFFRRLGLVIAKLFSSVRQKAFHNQDTRFRIKELQ